MPRPPKSVPTASQTTPFPLSVTLITLNEERNLPRALASVRGWADEIIVVDSGSTDRTVAIAEAAGARVISNPWPGYGKQKNFAQDQARNDWVLNIDADEEVSPELRAEISLQLGLPESPASPLGYEIPRKTYYLGRWILHGGWYPNHLARLARRHKSRWTEPDVHEELVIQGTKGLLKAPLLHYSFGSIQDQIRTNLRFSWLGFQSLVKRGQRPSLLKLILKPIGKFIETYVLKRGFLDGLPGFIISVNAAHSMFLKYAYLFEARLNGRGAEPNANSDRRQ